MDEEALNAVIKGDLSKLKERLKYLNVNINAQDECGRTLLHYAANQGQPKLIECLLKNGADVLITTVKNNTALHVAVTEDNKATTTAILVNVARHKLLKLLNKKTSVSGTTVLHMATVNDCYVKASFLLRFGANFEISNHDGERPIDAAITDDLRTFFQMIALCFEKAKQGDDQLISDILEKCNRDDLPALLNCRNNDGYTLMQVLMLCGHKTEKLTNNTLAFRIKWCMAGERSQNQLLREANRLKDLDKLAERIKECRNFWLKKGPDIVNLVRRETAKKVHCVMSHACKESCSLLEKAHRVLLAYQELEFKHNLMTNSPAMKSIEEALEIFGFNPEKCYATEGKTDGYYNKLLDKWKENIHSFVLIVNGVIDVSISALEYGLISTQLFQAVTNDDVAEMKKLMVGNYGSPFVDPTVINSFHYKRRTILGYASENGNEKMVELLLESGAKVARESMLSSVYLAVKKCHAKVVKLLLENIETTADLNKFIDCREECQRTALHVAAVKGRLDIVKILLRYGATYQILDADNRTPLDLSRNKEVIDFLKFVDDFFNKAKNVDADLVEKLKAMPADEFMAIVGTRNQEGRTLIDVIETNDKNNAEIIRERKTDEEWYEKIDL